jgi:hypothetical protein
VQNSSELVVAADGATPTSVQVTLPPEKAALVPDIVGKYSIATAPGTDLVTYGQQPIGAFSTQLDAMLDQVTKADSPVLFELFRRVSTSVKQINLPELEADIRRKLDGGLLSRVLSMVGLGNRAAQLEKVADEIRGMLQSKATSLLELVRPLEQQINTESAKLIGELGRLEQQARLYRSSILDLGVYVEAGRQILVAGKGELARLEATAGSSNDPLQVREARDFGSRVDLFENRLLALETAYAKAPVDLESIGIAQSAGLMTLADTVSSAQTEFNDIKSALLRLHATFQIRSLQQLNTLRRQLRAELQKYSLQQLETVAVDATRSAADARLEDAQLLGQMAAALGNISVKVDAEREKNRAKADTARATLVQAQQAVAQLKAPADAATM